MKEPSHELASDFSESGHRSRRETEGLCCEDHQKMICGSKASAMGPTKRDAVRLPSWNRPHTYDTCSSEQMRMRIVHV